MRDEHFGLKIDGDKLTIYPIGIETSPRRENWKINDDYVDAAPNQDTPAIVPTKDLGHHLIEDPIVIDIACVSPP